MFTLVPHFDFSEYRLHTGFERPKSAHIEENADILCVGCCDLWSINPTGVVPFTWAEYFGNRHRISRIGQPLPLHCLVEYISQYLTEYTEPDVIFLVLPIIAETASVKGKRISITENSTRVIKYLELKSIITSADAEDFYTKSDKCRALTDNDKIIYYENQFSVIKDITQGCKLFWMPNGTPSANRFFAPIIDSLSTKMDTYAGWVDNRDTLPDSSIGAATHRAIFETFSRVYDKNKSD